MTPPETVNQLPRTVVGRPAAIDARVQRVLTLEWEIGTKALAGAGPFGDLGTPTVLRIVVSLLAGGTSVAQASLIGTTERPLIPGPLGSAPDGMDWTHADGLWHLDAGALLRATWREIDGESGGEVLYARTGLLRMLGLPGGRYEFKAGSFTDSH